MLPTSPMFFLLLVLLCFCLQGTAGCTVELVISHLASDSCSSTPTTEEECLELALQHSDLAATTDITVQYALDRPYGCWWQASNSELFFNRGGFNNNCSEASACVCCGSDGTTTTMDQATCSLQLETSLLPSELRDASIACEPISYAACLLAPSTLLGEDTTIETVFQSEEDRPSGCWYQPADNRFFFNNMSTQIECSASQQCVCCGFAEQVASLSTCDPVLFTSNHPYTHDCRASSVPQCQILGEEVAGLPSILECQAESQDTSPSGCYFDAVSGELRYNSAVTRVDCSQETPCVCCALTTTTTITTTTVPPMDLASCTPVLLTSTHPFLHRCPAADASQCIELSTYASDLEGLALQSATLVSSSALPTGCYLDTDAEELFYNEMPSFTTCSEDYPCLCCIDTTITSTSTSTIAPMDLSSCSPLLIDSGHPFTRGCPAHTSDQCLTLAEAYGQLPYTDNVTTTQSEVLPSGCSYDPASATLYFNDRASYTHCSEDHVCVCCESTTTTTLTTTLTTTTRTTSTTSITTSITSTTTTTITTTTTTTVTSTTTKTSTTTSMTTTSSTTTITSSTTTITSSTTSTTWTTTTSVTSITSTTSQTSTTSTTSATTTRSSTTSSTTRTSTTLTITDTVTLTRTVPPSTTEADSSGTEASTMLTTSVSDGKGTTFTASTTSGNWATSTRTSTSSTTQTSTTRTTTTTLSPVLQTTTVATTTTVTTTTRVTTTTIIATTTALATTTTTARAAASTTTTLPSTSIVASTSTTTTIPASTTTAALAQTSTSTSTSTLLMSVSTTHPSTLTTTSGASDSQATTGTTTSQTCDSILSMFSQPGNSNKTTTIDATTMIEVFNCLGSAGASSLGDVAVINETVAVFGVVLKTASSAFSQSSLAAAADAVHDLAEAVSWANEVIILTELGSLMDTLLAQAVTEQGGLTASTGVAFVAALGALARAGNSAASSTSSSVSSSSLTSFGTTLATLMREVGGAVAEVMDSELKTLRLSSSSAILFLSRGSMPVSISSASTSSASALVRSSSSSLGGSARRLADCEGLIWQQTRWTSNAPYFASSSPADVEAIDGAEVLDVRSWHCGLAVEVAVGCNLNFTLSTSDFESEDDLYCLKWDESSTSWESNGQIASSTSTSTETTVACALDVCSGTYTVMAAASSDSAVVPTASSGTSSEDGSSAELAIAALGIVVALLVLIGLCTCGIVAWKCGSAFHWVEDAPRKFTSEMSVHDTLKQNRCDPADIEKGISSPDAALSPQVDLESIAVVVPECHGSTDAGSAGRTVAFAKSKSTGLNDAAAGTGAGVGREGGGGGGGVETGAETGREKSAASAAGVGPLDEMEESLSEEALPAEAPSENLADPSQLLGSLRRPAPTLSRSITSPAGFHSSSPSTAPYRGGQQQVSKDQLRSRSMVESLLEESNQEDSPPQVTATVSPHARGSPGRSSQSSKPRTSQPEAQAPSQAHALVSLLEEEGSLQGGEYSSVTNNFVKGASGKPKSSKKVGRRRVSKRSSASSGTASIESGRQLISTPVGHIDEGNADGRQKSSRRTSQSLARSTVIAGLTRRSSWKSLARASEGNSNYPETRKGGSSIPGPLESRPLFPDLHACEDIGRPGQERIPDIYRSPSRPREPAFFVDSPHDYVGDGCATPNFFLQRAQGREASVGLLQLPSEDQRVPGAESRLHSQSARLEPPPPPPPKSRRCLGRPFVSSSDTEVAPPPPPPPPPHLRHLHHHDFEAPPPLPPRGASEASLWSFDDGHFQVVVRDSILKGGDLKPRSLSPPMPPWREGNSRTETPAPPPPPQPRGAVQQLLLSTQGNLHTDHGSPAEVQPNRRTMICHHYVHHDVSSPAAAASASTATSMPLQQQVPSRPLGLGLDSTIPTGSSAALRQLAASAAAAATASSTPAMSGPDARQATVNQCGPSAKPIQRQASAASLASSDDSTVLSFLQARAPGGNSRQQQRLPKRSETEGFLSRGDGAALSADYLAHELQGAGGHCSSSSSRPTRDASASGMWRAPLEEGEDAHKKPGKSHEKDYARMAGAGELSRDRYAARGTRLSMGGRIDSRSHDNQCYSGDVSSLSKAQSVDAVRSSASPEDTMPWPLKPPHDAPPLPRMSSSSPSLLPSSMPRHLQEEDGQAGPPLYGDEAPSHRSSCIGQRQQVSMRSSPRRQPPKLAAAPPEPAKVLQMPMPMPMPISKGVASLVEEEEEEEGEEGEEAGEGSCSPQDLRAVASSGAMLCYSTKRSGRGECERERDAEEMYVSPQPSPPSLASSPRLSDDLHTSSPPSPTMLTMTATEPLPSVSPSTAASTSSPLAGKSKEGKPRRHTTANQHRQLHLSLPPQPLVDRNAPPEEDFADEVATNSEDGDQTGHEYWATTAGTLWGDGEDSFFDSPVQANVTVFPRYGASLRENQLGTARESWPQPPPPPQRQQQEEQKKHHSDCIQLLPPPTPAASSSTCSKAPSPRSDDSPAQALRQLPPPALTPVVEDAVPVTTRTFAPPTPVPEPVAMSMSMPMQSHGNEGHELGLDLELELESAASFAASSQGARRSGRSAQRQRRGPAREREPRDDEELVSPSRPQEQCQYNPLLKQQLHNSNHPHLQLGQHQLGFTRPWLGVAKEPLSTTGPGSKINPAPASRLHGVLEPQLLFPKPKRLKRTNRVSSQTPSSRE